MSPLVALDFDTWDGPSDKSVAVSPVSLTYQPRLTQARANAARAVLFPLLFCEPIRRRSSHAATKAGRPTWIRGRDRGSSSLRPPFCQEEPYAGPVTPFLTVIRSSSVGDLSCCVAGHGCRRLLHVHWNNHSYYSCYRVARRL